jgi:hypothetical protein
LADKGIRPIPKAIFFIETPNLPIANPTEGQHDRIFHSDANFAAKMGLVLSSTRSTNS